MREHGLPSNLRVTVPRVREARMHHRRLLRECPAALLLVLLFAASNEAAAKQVLLLHSSETISTTGKQAASFRANLNHDRVEPVSFFEFVLNPFGFTNP